ncbi:MAG: glycine--tRNA ligase subunit beta, partial [Gammaproteobacteria bacterium]|nr:glycine--tRNA ligase subunit beta [Gammaproteobacteria bacterium]
MSSKDFLVELGTEELPPRSLPAFIEHLQTGFTAQLDHARLLYTGIQAFATPRRLAVLVSGLALQQPDQTVDKRGPALKAAFDDNGQPTPAARGFAQSCGTTV